MEAGTRATNTAFPSPKYSILATSKTSQTSMEFFLVLSLISFFLTFVCSHNFHRPVAGHKHALLARQDDTCSTASDCGIEAQCCHGTCLQSIWHCCSATVFCNGAEHCYTDDQGGMCCCEAGRTCTGPCPPPDSTTTTTSQSTKPTTGTIASSSRPGPYLNTTTPASSTSVASTILVSSFEPTTSSQGSPITAVSTILVSPSSPAATTEGTLNISIASPAS